MVGVQRTGVVYLDLSWASLPSLLRWSVGKADSWSLRCSLGPRGERWIRRAFRVRAIDISLPDDFIIVPGSSESAMRRAIAAVDQTNIERLIDYFAAALPGIPRAGHALRSALLRPIGQRSLDAFYVECWARSLGWSRTRVVTATGWDALLIADPAAGVTTVGAVSRAIRAGLAIGAQVTRRLRRERQRPTPAGTPSSPSTSPASIVTTESPSPIGPVGPQAKQASVALILNMGRVFGGLYAYDHVLADDVLSPLHVSQVVHMSSDGSAGHRDGVPHAYPRGGSPLRILRAAIPLAWGALRLSPGRSRWQGGYPWRWITHLSWTVASAQLQARAIREAFPGLRVGILAYEVQLPMAFTLALQQAGVQTVAFSERPLSAMVETQPFVVGTLMTAGPEFSSTVRDSSAITVTDAPATGMWRTDLLRAYRRTPHPAWTDRRHRVLALPYHVEERPGFGNNPLAVSPPAVRQFLTDCLALAQRRPDVQVVIRGKNDRWRQHPDFADIAEQVANSDNVTVSSDYVTLNESYRLAAHADLVIAQYTSLADEVLAAGIPCVLHDYLPNSRGYGRGIAAHLPDMLWALSEDEWHERIDAALDDRSAFQAAWRGHGERLYGDLADGQVRARARALILAMLDTPD